MGWLLGSGGKVKHVCLRAVGRSENPGVPVLFGEHNLPPLVEIGLTDQQKTPPGTTGLCLLSSNPSMFIRTVSSKRLLSTLQNHIELVYGRVWAEQHAQYTEISDPDQPGRKPM